MGSDYFCTISEGESPGEALRNAVAQAKYDFGNNGYTGTIAEKSNYTMATYDSLSQKSAYELANELKNTAYSDKWGPAGAIRINDNKKTYIFFGWASS